MSATATIVKVNDLEIPIYPIEMDVNGNSRFVVHFLSLGIELKDYGKIKGLTKYRGKWFGGGYVEQEGNIVQTLQYMLKCVDEYYNPVYEHGVKVGDKASGTYWSDSTPFEVVAISKSTITLREMNWKVVEGSEQNGSAEYEYFSNTENGCVTARKTKTGWKTPGGMKIYVGHARRYYDPSF